MRTAPQTPRFSPGPILPREQGGLPSGCVLVVVLCTAILLCALPAEAQISVRGRGKNFVAPVTDAQGRKTVLKGESFKPAENGRIEITRMLAETYRGQEKDMVVEAAQCFFDSKASVASSREALSIRTMDERFSIQGKSFRWQLGDTRANGLLIISNQVHSVLRRPLLTKPPSPHASEPTAGSSPAIPEGDVIDVVSESFEYQSDTAVFRGNVRAHEAEGDLSCGVLRAVYEPDSRTLKRIEAEREVVLTQGSTRTVADKAIYTVTEGEEVVEFIGHVLWDDGERQGSGDKVIVDRRRRTLEAHAHAYLKLPRSALIGPGLLSVNTAQSASRSARPGAAVEVFSESIRVQLPATNGPVQRIIADKNVLIVDPEQDGRALADHAEYQESTETLQLTGSPVMETERRLVTGQVLKFNRATRVFTAGPDAYVKLPYQTIAQLDLIPAGAQEGTNSLAGTNRFIEVWASQFESATNLLRFTGNVRANFLENDIARGQLTCGALTIRYGKQIESLLAEGTVELEQFADAQDPDPSTARVSCEALQARFSPAGKLEFAEAEHGVHAEQEKRARGQSAPTVTTLQSRLVKAFFSSGRSAPGGEPPGRTFLSQVARLVAEEDVTIAQDAKSARGARAEYTGRDGLLQLTGEPSAVMPEGQIHEAERLIWDQTHGRLIGKGRFKSQWKRPQGETNRLSNRLATPE